MCKSIPFEAPWQAKRAVQWDRITLGEWLHDHVRSKQARDMLGMALAGIYTSAASPLGPSTGRWPPNLVTHCVFRDPCT